MSSYNPDLIWTDLLLVFCYFIVLPFLISQMAIVKEYTKHVSELAFSAYMKDICAKKESLTFGRESNHPKIIMCDCSNSSTLDEKTTEFNAIYEDRLLARDQLQNDIDNKVSQFHKPTVHCKACLLFGSY